MRASDEGLRGGRWQARLAAVAVAGAAVTGLTCAPAGAMPISAQTPRIALGRPTPPTTEICRAAFGVACYQPGQIEKAYNLPALWKEGIEGQGQTIVIVDSFGSPTIRRDLKQFDAAFSLPDPPSLKVIAPAGAIPPFNPHDKEMSGWAFETSLDVEYAHAIAPQANILLVETPVAETEGTKGFPQIVAAENYVVSHHLGEVISQSFGATEETFPSPESILALRSANINAASEGVSVLAASGDFGSTDFEKNLKTIYRERVTSWPPSDPLVTAIGGTQLHLDEAGNRTAPDNVWNDIPIGIDAAGGGGPSHVFGRPEFQQGVNTGSGPARAVPDISMSAAVDGGVLVYTSYVSTVPGEPEPNTFTIVGGTSEATPLFAGVVALADQVAGHSLGWLNPRLYALSQKANNGIVDITKGNNTFTFINELGEAEFTVPGFAARAGYDMASGLGTVDARRFAHALAKP
jgi:subtilase family serine protease